MLRMYRVFGSAILLLFAVACSESESSEKQVQSNDTAGVEDITKGRADTHDPDTKSAYKSPYAGYNSDHYAQLDKWLCHSELKDDHCSVSQDTSVVAADGSVTIEAFEPAKEPSVDCFYVYPTASADPVPNSDWEPGLEEPFAVTNQAARFTKHCRVFAPVYRQTTVATLLNSDIKGDSQLAYGDVIDAFKHYMANYNEGRGIVLMGHSQGSYHLKRVIREEFEDVPSLMNQLVAAYLIGTNILVAKGSDVGGDFKTVPLCRSVEQTACVVAYVSYRATDPPTGDARFGQTDQADRAVACNNPASLSDGKSILNAYFPTSVVGVLSAVRKKGQGAFSDMESAPELTTSYFSVPGLIQGECVQKDGFSYFEITLFPDPDDPRTDDIGGDFTPGWGLHLVDVNLAMGDLVNLLGSQVQQFHSSRD